MTLRCLMWRSLNEWQDMMEKWIKTSFGQIDAVEIEKQAEKYSKISVRLEKNLDANPIQVLLKEKVDKFKDAMPIVTSFRNQNLKEETHWVQIRKLVDKEFDITQEDFTLKSLLDLDVNQFKDDIVAISISATQEANLEVQLNDLQDIWSKTHFVVEVDEKSECLILKELDDIYQALDESLAQINTILASRFVKPLRPKAETW